MICFDSHDVWRSCCDLEFMRRRFGRDTARQISRRLQQLDALNDLDDIEFLPFRSRLVDGHLEVDVNDDVTLLVNIAPADPGRPHAMTTINIHSIRSNGRPSR